MILHDTINIGDKIGRWEVLSPADPVIRNNKKIRRWLCRCECGTERVVRELSLKQETSKSCGCLHKEIASEACRANMTTHGMSNTRLYAIYKHMCNRCYRPTDSRYSLYGGRGITVCDEWLDSFEAFYNWSIKNGYNDSLSIDRKDFNGSYTPDNCRWANDYEQSNNRSCNKNYTYKDETHTISEWAKIFDMPYKKLWKRLEVLGWEISKALTT